MQWLGLLAQETVFTIPSNSSEISHFTIDFLGDCFWVNGDQEVFKENSTSKLYFKPPDGFTVDKLGLNNVHKSFLFSNDLQSIIILDNQLTSILQIDFEDFELWNVIDIDYSLADKLYILSTDNRKVYELNTRSQELDNSFDLREIAGPIESFNIKATENYVYIYDSNQCYQYSRLGKYISCSPITNEMMFDEEGDCFYIDEQGLKEWDRLAPQDRLIIELNNKTIKKPHIRNEALYYLDSLDIIKYKMN